MFLPGGPQQHQLALQDLLLEISKFLTIKLGKTGFTTGSSSFEALKKKMRFLRLLVVLIALILRISIRAVSLSFSFGSPMEPTSCTGIAKEFGWNSFQIGMKFG